MNDQANCYVAKCTCGGLVMAAVDNPNRKKDTAKEVAMAIKKGFAVSQMTVVQVRVSTFCQHQGRCKDQGQLFSGNEAKP